MRFSASTLARAFRRRVLPLLVPAAFAAGCSGDNGTGPDDPGGGTENAFTVHASLDEVTYFAPVASLTEGSVTFQGAGAEIEAFGAVSIGEYVYAEDFAASELVQLLVTGTGYQRVNALSVPALTTQGYFRTLRRVEPDILLAMTWPDVEGRVDWARIQVPGFTVASRGSFTVSPVEDGQAPVEVGSPIVSGGRVYLGAMFWREDNLTFADSVYTIVLDYPSFTNPTIFATDASVGTTAGWNSATQFTDELGDVYQSNIRSKHWYNMGTAPDKPTVITRIRSGETAYDPTYVLDVSSFFDEPVSLIGFDYVGGGIAYGRLLYENATDVWDEAYAGNYGAVVRIDLATRTVTPVDLPAAPVIQVGGPLVYEGKYYIPVAPVGSEAHIYELDPTQTNSAPRQGARLEGGSLQAIGLYAHTLPAD